MLQLGRGGMSLEGGAGLGVLGKSFLKKSEVVPQCAKILQAYDSQSPCKPRGAEGKKASLGGRSQTKRDSNILLHGNEPSISKILHRK